MFLFLIFLILIKTVKITVKHTFYIRVCRKTKYVYVYTTSTNDN